MSRRIAAHCKGFRPLTRSSTTGSEKAKTARSVKSTASTKPVPAKGSAAKPRAAKTKPVAGVAGPDESRSAALPEGANPAAETIALVHQALEDMKAEDIMVIDLRGKTSLADAMIIATGRVNRHVAAIADSITEVLKAAGSGTLRTEGQPACDWVLIDTGDIIVHIFRPEVREFYNLEKMWSADRPTEQSAPQNG